jgi:hypothetical protein
MRLRMRSYKDRRGANTNHGAAAWWIDTAWVMRYPRGIMTDPLIESGGRV